MNQPNAGFPASQRFNVEFGVDLVSLNNGSMVTAGAHSFSGQVGTLYFRQIAQSIPVIMGAFNLNVIFTSCQLNSSQANLSWTNLSSADIISGVVPLKQRAWAQTVGTFQLPFQLHSHPAVVMSTQLRVLSKRIAMAVTIWGYS